MFQWSIDHGYYLVVRPSMSKMLQKQPQCRASWRICSRRDETLWWLWQMLVVTLYDSQRRKDLDTFIGENIVKKRENKILQVETSW